MNLLSQQGVFTEALKTVRVKPIFKKDNPQFPSKHHPIVFSVISKLYEKCMFSRRHSVLTKYKTLFQKQFGFGNNHSTIHALINIVDLIKKYLDNDYFVCGIFIDLKKAFDTTVYHDILVAKYDHYGIRGLFNSWLISFLKTRTQHVYLDGHSTITKEVTCGVPQGSTFGPLLAIPFLH